MEFIIDQNSSEAAHVALNLKNTGLPWKVNGDNYLSKIEGTLDSTSMKDSYSSQTV